MKNLEGFSIIVCCYNSSARIKPTLKHLAALDTCDKPTEVILVDNNCQDDTVEVASEFWFSELDNPYDLIVVKEYKAGLSFAREKGVSMSRYSYGVFCDDDNWLSENYLETILNTFRSNASIGIVGGVSYPVSDSKFPAWFFNRAKSFAVGIQAEKTGLVTKNHWLWGAGMAFRVEVLMLIYSSGVKSLLSDRSGASLTSGGDNEICAWFIFKGYELWYDNSLTISHYMSNDRLTDNYYQRFFNQSYPTAWPVYSSFLDLAIGSSGELNCHLSVAQKIERKVKSIICILRNYKIFFKILKLRRIIKESKLL